MATRLLSELGSMAPLPAGSKPASTQRKTATETRLEEGSDDLESGAEAPTSRWARVHEDPDNVYAAIHTGDEDTGDREQELLMTCATRLRGRGLSRQRHTSPP